MYLKYIFLILSLFILLPSVSATTTLKTCSGGYAWENTTYIIDDTTETINSKPVLCPFGCANNGLECAEPAENDSGMMMVAAMIISAVAFLFVYISNTIEWGGDKYNWPLKVMFLMGALLFVLLDVGLISGYGSFNQNSMASLGVVSYTVVIFMLLVTLLAFLVFLLIFTVESALSYARGRNEKKK